MPEFRVDSPELPAESEKLIGQLAVSHEEKTDFKAETSGNEVLKSEEAIKLWKMRKILKEFIQKANFKGSPNIHKS